MLQESQEAPGHACKASIGLKICCTVERFSPLPSDTGQILHRQISGASARLSFSFYLIRPCNEFLTALEEPTPGTRKSRKRKFLPTARKRRVASTRRGCTRAAVEESSLAVISPGSRYWDIDSKANGPTVLDTMCKTVYSVC